MPNHDVPQPAKDKGPVNHPISLEVVVAGESEDLRVKPDDLIDDVLEKALKKSKNVAQPVTDWEIKTAAGLPLTMGQTIAALGIADGDVLYASLKAGAAG
jgi:hypothetical protein